MPRRSNTTPKVGRRTSLTTHRADTIIEAVEGGNHLGTACDLAGIGRSTLYAWITRADAVEDAINKGLPYDRDDERFLEFRDRLQVARARAEADAIGIVWDDMRGGRLVSYEPVLDKDGNAQFDANGDVIAIKKWSQPNGRLALTWAARATPERWSDKQRVELVTGDMEPTASEDGQVAPEVVAGALDLAKRLAITQRAREDGEDDVDGAVDAEIVEDESA